MEEKNKIAFKLTEGTTDLNILFIHGTGCNHTIFDALIKLLPDYNCYAIDLPGHGESEDTGYNFNNYVNSVVEFIKDMDNVLIVGHSLGGSIGLAVCAKKLPNITGLMTLSSGATFHKLDKDFLAKIHEGKVDKKFLLKESGSILNLDVLKSLTKMESDTISIKDFYVDEELDIRECLKDIDVKTHVITGANDKVGLPEYSELIAKEVKVSRLTLVPGYKHMLFLAKKRLIAQYIKEF
ncbi:alpha/beta fold hydrolase [Clostridium tertium]|uniref:alpha/beta fold hydrolase n=1 Tax=Clostridium tertium TaxID=1559 RepID=UPI0023B3019F|nr:alpha/beta hydrolase [Clostridium tertium]